MENGLLIAGALLLLAAAIPQSRKTIARKLNIPDDFGLSIFDVFNGGSSSPTPNASSYAPPGPQPAQKNVFNPRSLPSNRKLTIAETFDLANYYAFNVFGGRIEPSIIVAMAMQESSLRPWASRTEPDGRKSVGLMQTLIGTAEDMYGRGYTAVGKPTEQSLALPYVSMYFGMAYMDWLQKSYPNRHNQSGGHNSYWEWYVRAYNGGPGWERTSRGPSMTATHWAKVKANLNTVDATLEGGIA